MWSAPLDLSPNQMLGVAGVDQGPGPKLVCLEHPRQISMGAREARTGRVRWTRVLPGTYQTHLFAAVHSGQVVEAVEDAWNSIRVTGLDAESDAVGWRVRLRHTFAFQRLVVGDPPIVVAVECTSTAGAGHQPIS